MTKPTVGAAVREQRRVTVDVLSSLEPAQWEQPVDRHAGPSIRSVAAALVAFDEAAVTGRLFGVCVRSRDSSALVDVASRSAATWQQRSVDELLTGMVVWGDRLGRLTAWGGRLVLDRVAVHTPWGRQPLLWTVRRHVMDEWRYAATVADAFGKPLPHEGPAVARTMANAVLATMPQVVLPAVSRAVGVLRLVVLLEPTGERRLTWGIDFARKHYGPRVTRPPDATVRLPARTLVALCGGDVTWRGLEPGVVEVTGDTELAADVLDALPTSAGSLVG